MPEALGFGTPQRSSSTGFGLDAGAVAFGSVHVWVTRMPDSKGKRFGNTAKGHKRSAQLHVIRSGALMTRDLCTDNTFETFMPGEGFFTLGVGVPMIADRESEVLTVALPAEKLSSPWQSDMSLRVDSVLLAPTADFIAQTMLIVDRSRVTEQHLHDLIPRMVDGLLVPSNGAAPAPPAKVSGYLAATAVLAQRCSEPGLTAEAIASAVSLSPRQLQRIFRARGTTIHSELRRLRVKQARLMLQDRRYDVLAIDEVAKRSGFGDRSSLTRALAAVGLPAPSQIRREAAER